MWLFMARDIAVIQWAQGARHKEVRYEGKESFDQCAAARIVGGSDGQWRHRPS
jgi:hypothetical protein